MLSAGLTAALALSAAGCGSGGPANIVTADPVPPREFQAPERVTVEHDAGDPLEPAPVLYTQRQGGLTFYSNNPEQVTKSDLADVVNDGGIETGGVVWVRERHMTGQWTTIFEHGNHTGLPVYFGLRLDNEGDTDAFITVSRIGYQYTGDWCGTEAFADYYQVNFPLPEDYFDEFGQVKWYYRLNGLREHQYRPFTETTYRLPPGKHMYVVGGTSADAFDNYNVGGTADRLVTGLQAVNGVADFYIRGGDITGSMMAYTNADNIVDNPRLQGYILRETTLGGHTYHAAEQYGGISDGLAVVENHMTWRIGDDTPAQKLPGTFIAEYAQAGNRTKEPYTKYENITRENRWVTEWTTNLNPQAYPYPHVAGSDILAFRCVDEFGVERIIDRFHTDGAGNPANICNWMVSMRSTYTIENASARERTVRIYNRSSGRGIAVVKVYDAADNLLKSYLKTHPFMLDHIGQVPDNLRDRYFDNNDVWIPIINGERYNQASRALAYEIVAPQLEAVTITVEYVMLANSWGGVAHYVEID
jgi:hypothetical protein